MDAEPPPDQRPFSFGALNQGACDGDFRRVVWKLGASDNKLAPNALPEELLRIFVQQSGVGLSVLSDIEVTGPGVNDGVGYQ